MYASIDEILDLKDFTQNNYVVGSDQQFPLTLDCNNLQQYSLSNLYNLPYFYSEFSYKAYDLCDNQLNKGTKFNTIAESTYRNSRRRGIFFL